jgi:hypothetical protein
VFAACAKNVTPEVSPEEATRRSIQISELTTSIMSKPKPAPPAPPAEEKKEEKTETAEKAAAEEPMDVE